MSPLSYLLFTRFKNQIKGVFRSPAKLIYAVILIALLVILRGLYSLTKFFIFRNFYLLLIN